VAFMLSVRFDDHANWSKPEAYTSRKERDKDAAFARCIGGLRTHSWTETRAEQSKRLAPGGQEGT